MSSLFFFFVIHLTLSSRYRQQQKGNIMKQETTNKELKETIKELKRIQSNLLGIHLTLKSKQHEIDYILGKS